MNKKGHKQTLVASHPENRNAVKSGVFSDAALAPRMAELEVAIAERRVDDAVRDLLRRELAALAALGEAMDESLAADGVRGRNAQPRSLINLRLRLNEKLRRTAQQYANAQAAATPEAASPGGDAPDEPRDAMRIVDAIAAAHRRGSISDLAPHEVDQEAYLGAIIVATDAAVTTGDRIRARKMLTKWRKARPSTCVCFSTLRSRDELEFREWIDLKRDVRSVPARNDGSIASVVRRVAAGERLEPWAFHQKMIEATNDVMAEGAHRARAGEPYRDDPGNADPTLAPLWAAALSPRKNVSVKERLDALSVLDGADALPRCTCDPEPEHQLHEDRIDAWYAYTIRLVAQKHYRAALHIARYPETYLAVRDVTDAKVAAELAASITDGERPPDA